MSDCRKYQELISLMLDGELSTEKTVELNVHMARCPECRAMYEAFEAVGSALKCDENELPADLHDSIMSGVKASAGKKRGTITHLRRYASAAACVALIVAAALAVKGSGALSADSASMAMDTTAGSESVMFSAKAAADEAPAQTEAESGDIADGAVMEESASTTLESDAGLQAEAASPKDEEAAPELDIASSTVETTGSAGTSTENLNAVDSVVWLKALISGESSFAGGEDISAISYVFTAEKRDGEKYTVYMFYGDDGLRASLYEDRSESVPIYNFNQLAALVSGAK